MMPVAHALCMFCIISCRSCHFLSFCAPLVIPQMPFSSYFACCVRKYSISFGLLRIHFDNCWRFTSYKASRWLLVPSLVYMTVWIVIVLFFLFQYSRKSGECFCLFQCAVVEEDEQGAAEECS